MTEPLSRRRFLGAAVQTGIGAAVASGGALGASLRSVAAAAPVATTPRLAASPPTAASPGTPPGYWSLVSRPDLKPPQMAVTTAPGATLPGEPGYIFSGVTTAPGGTYPAGAQGGLMISTRLGELVWFQPLFGPSNLPFNFRTQTYNGKQVLTWFQGILGPGFGLGGQYRIMDTSYSPVTSFSAIGYESDLHEFLLTPQGTALVSAYESRNNGQLIICHAQEIDVASRQLVWEWDSSVIPLSDSYIPDTGDTFHLNSIDPWPDPSLPSDRWDFLISGRQVSAVYRISRATKAIVWQAGGKRSTLNMVGPATRFEFQHDARALPDASGFSVFDDASQNPLQVPAVTPEKQSWGKVFNLDTSAKEVTIRHQYNNTNMHIQTGSQGNVQLLPTGGHMVGFGAANAFSEFGPSGAAVEAPMILDGRFPVGVESYRVFLNDWSATPPVSELAFTVQRGSAPGAFTGFASWNGATAVTTWQVLAGTSGNALQPVLTAAKTRFETTIPFTASGATQFQVAAYDTNGNLLGTSPAAAAV